MAAKRSRSVGGSRRHRRWRGAFLFGAIVLAYLGMQVYAVMAAYQDLGLAPSFLVPLLGWALLMTFFPFLLWRVERGGWHRLATVGAWFGYTWMGFVFLFFWIALALKVVVAVVAASGALGVAGDVTSGVRTFPLAVALTLVVAVYGYFAARRTRVEHVTLTSEKLPDDHAPLRIALLSDVHLGALVGERRLQRIVARVAALGPDIVFSAGDLVDGQADHLNRLAPLLADLRPPLGKFAVIGNHECYVGLMHALEFHARAGFTVLRGAAAEVTPAVAIVGVDDPAASHPGSPAATDERPALASVRHGRYVILLKHQPVVSERAAGQFDLQLSGHLHQGQIFPFALFVRLVYAATTGLTPIPVGGWLYVSRGTGTWGPPMRVLAPPEITLIELTPAR